MVDHAVTISGLFRPGSFRTTVIGLSRRGVMARPPASWVGESQGDLVGLASIRQRSGPKSWELSHLYSDSSSDQAVVRLLEMAAAGAGMRGAERVFLRVQSGSHILRAARLAGYFPSHYETVFRGASGLREPSHSLFDADSHLRPRRPEDDHALFRLYNAATPVKVRQLVGMTFDQWASSQEHGPGRSQESVLLVEGEVQGSVRTSASFGRGSLDVTLHPNYDALTREVVEAGLRRLKGARTVYAIAAEYAPRLSTALEEFGFEAQGEYAMLVKSVAQRVTERVPGRSSRVVVE